MIEYINEDEIYFAKTKSSAIIPSKRDEDAGYDIYTAETETIVIPPCSVRLIDSGVAIACNQKWFPKFFDKGGMGSLGIIVGAGVGDSGYRDGYFIPLCNINKDKWLIISTQSKEQFEKANCFDTRSNQFTLMDERILKGSFLIERGILVPTENCIYKPINKAITQFVILEVPKLTSKEITWEELKAIPSERGLGKMGSSGK